MGIFRIVYLVGVTEIQYISGEGEVLRTDFFNIYYFVLGNGQIYLHRQFRPSSNFKPYLRHVSQVHLE